MNDTADWIGATISRVINRKAYLYEDFTLSIETFYIIANAVYQFYFITFLLICFFRNCLRQNVNLKQWHDHRGVGAIAPLLLRWCL